MAEWALHSTPRPRGVFREQVSAVALALRPAALAAAALLALATLFIATKIVREGAVVGFHPERWILPGIAGLLLPIVVWRGEARFGPSFLWTLPVDRRVHALARVCAGWVWLMAAVACFVLWLLTIALASGGSVMADETLKLIPPFPLLGPAPLDPAIIRTARWTPEPLLLLVPFAAATGTYLLSSALALGLRHPLRWIAGTVLGVFLIVAASDAANADGLAQTPERMMEVLVGGRYGLEAFLIAGTESLRIETTLTTGERVVVWRGLPDPAQWAAATLLWTGAGLALLWAAAFRHRENRRG